MKVAILSESPADEAAVCVLMQSLLGIAVESIPRRVRPGGWNAAVEAIPPTLKELQYRRTASALVVVIDSDNSVVHRPEHERHGSGDGHCRVCQLQKIIADVRQQLRQQPGQSPIATAVAVAVPAIEAWYLCGSESRCTEAGWVMEQNQGTKSKARIQKLKRLAYGTDRPSIEIEKARATELAAAQARNLRNLEQFFPVSFGHFAAEVRSWLPREGTTA